MRKITTFFSVIVAMAALLSACSNADIEPEVLKSQAVSKIFIKKFTAAGTPDAYSFLNPPPALRDSLPSQGDIPLGSLRGWIVPRETFRNYDGYELKCGGFPFAKKRIAWYDVTTQTTVAASSRRTDSKGQLTSSIGPSSGVDLTHEYHFYIRPDGLINPSASEPLTCFLYGLDFY